MIERTVGTDDGAQLWTVEDGSGPALILCHGGPGLWDYLGPVSPMVRDDVRVIRWDQRGCGRSAPASVHTVGRYIEDLETIRVAFGLQRWIVAGHSWGATLALQYALAHPEQTLGLLYVSGTGIGLDWNRAYHREADSRRTSAERARLDAISRRLRDPAEEAEYRLLTWLPDFAGRDRAATLIAALDRPFEINYEANRQIVHEMRGWIESDLAVRCGAMSARTLIVHGERDPRPAWSIDSLAAALPNASVEVLPDVGHFPWIENADVFEHHIKQFVWATSSE